MKWMSHSSIACLAFPGARRQSEHSSLHSKINKSTEEGGTYLVTVLKATAIFFADISSTVASPVCKSLHFSYTKLELSCLNKRWQIIQDTSSICCTTEGNSIGNSTLMSSSAFHPPGRSNSSTTKPRMSKSPTHFPIPRPSMPQFETSQRNPTPKTHHTQIPT